MPRTEGAIVPARFDRWFLRAAWAVCILAAGFVLVNLAGCETAPPIVETVIVEKPVPVPCRISPIERPRFAIDQVSPADDMVTINRALRAELEQRRAHETRLEAAVKACQ